MSPVLEPLYLGKREEAERLAEGAELDVFEAAALDRAERLRELLAADPSLARAIAPDGFTPLHLAAFFSAPRAARLLVDAGAEVDAVAGNPLRVTPLHSASAAGQLEIATLLLGHGADANATQSGGFTPIHAAAQNGDDALAELLLEHGAVPAALTDENRSAAELAGEAGHAELAERLRQSAP